MQYSISYVYWKQISWWSSTSILLSQKNAEDHRSTKNIQFIQALHSLHHISNIHSLNDLIRKWKTTSYSLPIDALVTIIWSAWKAELRIFVSPCRVNKSNRIIIHVNKINARALLFQFLNLAILRLGKWTNHELRSGSRAITWSSSMCPVAVVATPAISRLTQHHHWHR